MVTADNTLPVFTFYSQSVILYLQETPFYPLHLSPSYPLCLNLPHHLLRPGWRIKVLGSPAVTPGALSLWHCMKCPPQRDWKSETWEEGVCFSKCFHLTFHLKFKKFSVVPSPVESCQACMALVLDTEMEIHNGLCLGIYPIHSDLHGVKIRTKFMSSCKSKAFGSTI